MNSQISISEAELLAMSLKNLIPKRSRYPTLEAFREQRTPVFQGWSDYRTVHRVSDQGMRLSCVCNIF